MKQASLAIVLLLLAGCNSPAPGVDPGENDPGTTGGPGPSQSPTGEPAPDTDLAFAPVISMIGCTRTAVLFKADEAGARKHVPDQYAFSGDAILNAVLVLMDCPLVTINNASSLQDVRFAIDYVFLDGPSADTVYAFEAFTTNSTLALAMAALGLPVQVAEVQLAVSLEGGQFGISGPVSYSGTVAGRLDEDGAIPDQAFEFWHEDDGILRKVRQDVAFEVSSQLVAASTLTVESGALADMIPAGVQTVLADRSIVDSAMTSG